MQLMHTSIKALGLALANYTSEIRCNMRQSPRQATADMPKIGLAIAMHNEIATQQDTKINRKPKASSSAKALSENIEEEAAEHHVRSQDTTIYLFKSAFGMGLVMPSRYRALYVIYGFLINFFATFYFPIGFTLILFTLPDDVNVSNLLTSLQVTFDVYGGSAKIIIMKFVLEKLRATQKLTQLLDKRCRASDEVEELRQMVRFGKKVIIFYLTVFLCYSASTFLASVSSGYPPYSLYFPFIKWRRSHTEFIIASILEFIIMDFACLQQTVNDGYPVIYINMLRCHMKILQFRVEKLGTNPTLTKVEHLSELKLCIKDHQLLIELYDTIAPIISITLFIQFALSAVCIGTTLINIVIFANEFQTQVACGFFILAVLIEIYPACYFSQCLINESDKLADVIFHSNWIEQSAEYRKLIIFFLQRSQRPMFLTAGKLFPVTLSSFIAKFSFSLYTFIEKMNLKERFGIE
ncbi:PREDICTED: odorant receptor 42a-like [Bactrocera latifrons]|nr:PREDICTED: odorant receptor 42a-like [Bactrocera latifrons]